jgi:HD-GYP domain-containing protein (c-di-GMP phosphodiesterase class II)
MANTKTTLKVPVSDLGPGMYVSELDRPWLGTHYLIQGILIRSQEDIDDLARHCTYVMVDLDKSDPVVIPGLKAVRKVAHDNLAPRTPFHGTELYVDACSAEEERPAAGQAYDTASRLIDQIKTGMDKGLRLPVGPAQQAVDAMRESIVRNPDALHLLARMKRSGNALYDHAIIASIDLLAFGRHLGLPREELSALGLGGLLMDVGKLSLPAELLAKDGLLSAEGHRLMKQHVVLGEQLVAASSGISDAVRDIVSQHHERENGSGYPNGLYANQLHAYARMAAIVDSYEELMRAHSGTPTISPAQALKELRDNARWGLNPALVEQFAHCIGLFPVGSLVELISGEVAIVLTHGRAQRFLPCVMIILDPRKRPYDSPRRLDLRSAKANAGSERQEVVRDLPQGAYGIDSARYYL